MLRAVGDLSTNKGRRKAGKMFSLNFLLETMTFMGTAFSSTALEPQEAPSPRTLGFISQCETDAAAAV